MTGSFTQRFEALDVPDFQEKECAVRGKTVKTPQSASKVFKKALIRESSSLRGLIKG